MTHGHNDRPSILIVEDEADLRETLRFRLELEDEWTVYTASNGLEALGAVRQVHPDLLLCDVMMPGENGYRVARAIREDEASGLLPGRTTIVLLTARDLRGDPEREQMFADFSQADEVLYKPCPLAVVIERVRFWLASRDQPAYLDQQPEPPRAFLWE